MLSSVIAVAISVQTRPLHFAAESSSAIPQNFIFANTDAKALILSVSIRPTISTRGSHKRNRRPALVFDQAKIIRRAGRPWDRVGWRVARGYSRRAVRRAGAPRGRH